MMQKDPYRLSSPSLLFFFRYFFFLPLLFFLVAEREDFFFGTLAPAFRASLSPMAMACLRLFTLPPLPPFPERSLPRFRSCIASSILSWAFFEYFAMIFLFFKLKNYAIQRGTTFLCGIAEEHVYEKA